MRIDEFSRHEVERKSRYNTEDHSTNTGVLQERMIFNDSGEFHDVESICSGKFSHVPSQLAFVPSLRGMLSRDKSLRPDTWNLSGSSGNVFGSPLAVTDSSSTLYPRYASLFESKCYRRKPSARKYRETCLLHGDH